VNSETAPLLNSGRDQLDDILVLHLENGKDIFVTVKGVYQPSCFGASIDALVRMTLPIREYTKENIKEFEKSSASHDSVDSGLGNTTWLTQTNATFGQAYDIPKELWILADHIHRYGRDHRNLFRHQQNDAAALKKIRETLDCEIPERLPVDDIDAVAQSLIIFLESLPSRNLSSSSRRHSSSLPRPLSREQRQRLRGSQNHTDASPVSPERLSVLDGVSQIPASLLRHERFRPRMGRYLIWRQYVEDPTEAARWQTYSSKTQSKKENAVSIAFSR